MPKGIDIRLLTMTERFSAVHECSKNEGDDSADLSLLAMTLTAQTVRGHCSANARRSICHMGGLEVSDVTFIKTGIFA
jgi:hypothetical protein